MDFVQQQKKEKKNKKKEKKEKIRFANVYLPIYYWAIYEKVLKECLEIVYAELARSMKRNQITKEHMLAPDILKPMKVHTKNSKHWAHFDAINSLKIK